MKKIGWTLALLAASLSTPAIAEDEEEEKEKPPRVVRIGLGAEFVPDHVGAEGMKLGPLVNFDLKREGETFEFEAPDESFGFGLIGGDDFELGPALNLESSRKPSKFPVPIEKVNTTIEVGAFVQGNVSDEFRLRAEARKGIGGHDGWVSQISADYIARDEDEYVFSIGPRLSWADKTYHNAYFGVTPAAALASGLPAFDAGGGVRGVGAATSLHFQLAESWGIYGYGRYERLVGDAGRSPLIREYGSRDQFSAGLALTFTFRP